MTTNLHNLDRSNTAQAFWVMVGRFSSFALTIISSAVLSRYLSKIDYGTYRQIIYVYGILLIVFSAGLPQVFSYFLPRYSIEEGKDITWKITKVLGLTGLLFSIFLFSFSGIIATTLNNHELERGLKYFSPIPLFLLPTLGLEGIFSVYKKSVYIAIYNSITRILMLLFLVLPVILISNSYIYAIYGWIVVSIISLIIALKFKGIPFEGVKRKKSLLSKREILNYSLPLVAASIAEIIMRSADQFFISKYFGIKVFATYSNGFIQLPFVAMVTGATSIVIAPILSKMIFDKVNSSQIVTVWKSAILKSALLIYPLSFFFIFYANDIIEILYTHKYSDSIIYFRIAMILNFFNIIVFSPLLIALNKVKIYSLVNIILAFIIWSLGFVIVTSFPNPIFIGILSVSISIVRILFFIYYSSKQIRVKWWDLFPLKKLLVISTPCILILILIKIAYRFSNLMLGPIFEIGIASIIFVSLLFLYMRLFKNDYTLFFNPVISKGLKKIGFKK